MNQIKVLAVAFVLTALSFAASAANMFDSGDNCEAAAQAGFAEQYYPTKQSKGYGDDRIKGLKLTPAEADGCHLMDTAAGKKWVFLRKGTLVLTKDAQTVMLAECQNTIYESRDIVKPKATPVATVVQGTTTLVVNKTIERNEITIETVIKHVETCDDTTTRPKQNPVTKKLECPTVEVHVPVNVIADVTVTPNITLAPANVVVPVQPKVSKADECIDCHRETKLDRVEARNDGKCLVAFRNPGGQYHFALFDIKKGTDGILIGSWVADARGVLTNDPRKTIVGRNTGGREQAVQLRKPYDCKAVYEAMSRPDVMDFTAPRLGMVPACVPVAYNGRAGDARWD